MGRIAPEKSAKQVEKLGKKDGTHAVGGVSGLYLCVDGGARSWILRYSLNGRRADHGLGSYRDYTLAEARDRAREKRKLILDGIDPIEAKREKRDTDAIAARKRKNFGDCALEFLKAHKHGWRNEKHRAQWRSTLETYAKSLWKLDVSRVTTDLVYDCLEPIWTEKTETASRVRGRIEKVLDWATVKKYRSGENPARWKGNLENLLPKRSTVAKVEHHVALPYREAGSFMEELRKREGVSPRALEFLILTGVRSAELRGAMWKEIDIEKTIWTIPGERTLKNGKRFTGTKTGVWHNVPLSDAAISVLRKMDKHHMADGLVFPGMKEDTPMSDMTLGAVLKRMNRDDVDVHGFRSTLRDWIAEETNFPNHVGEMVLGHIVKGVEGDYRRGELLKKRRKVMDAWAAYCAKPSSKDDAKIIPFARRK